MYVITQPCMGIANKMALDVSENILRAEHISDFLSSKVFEKKGVEPLKNSVFGHFWKLIELNTDVLGPSLLSEIDNWFLLF